MGVGEAHEGTTGATGVGGRRRPAGSSLHVSSYYNGHLNVWPRDGLYQYLTLCNVWPQDGLYQYLTKEQREIVDHPSRSVHPAPLS